MIYRILSRNSLWMLCLLSFLAINMIFVGVDCIDPLAATAADSPKIINGNAADDSNDEQCSESDLYQYVEKIKNDIRGKWQPIKGFADRHVTVIFTVRQNGVIEDAKIIEGSGSQEVDRSTLEALKAASPLAPLPKGAPESIQIRYVFTWQVR